VKWQMLVLLQRVAGRLENENEVIIRKLFVTLK
jgi:hypothetical protein